MLKGQRIYQLDLFRFLAALSVVFYHYFFRGQAADDLSGLHFYEFGTYFKYGNLGVDLFFIISGFVIAMSISDLSVSNFVISRIVRLYPAYWFGVLFTFLVVYFFGMPHFNATVNQFLINLTMLEGFLHVKYLDGVYWTLSVELRFYFLVIVLLVVRKYFKRSFEIGVIAWLLLSIFYAFNAHTPLIKLLNLFFILEWSPYFIAGIMFLMVYEKTAKYYHYLFLVLCLLLSIINAIYRISENEMHYHLAFSPYVIGLVILFFYILMFLVTSNKLGFLNSKKWLAYGALTYPLYLIHQNVGYIIFNHFGDVMNKYVEVFATICSMLLISFAVNRWLEIPLSKWLKAKLKGLKESYIIAKN
ncbi:hypothetical protein BTR34_11975 [Maribacter hydrothermalis]|nr:hypothetical protein BTR34_11975 [Maribacter hydrothermalis]